jgi:hypothetical protein
MFIKGENSLIMLEIKHRQVKSYQEAIPRDNVWHDVVEGVALSRQLGEEQLGQDGNLRLLVDSAKSHVGYLTLDLQRNKTHELASFQFISITFAS